MIIEKSKFKVAIIVAAVLLLLGAITYQRFGGQQDTLNLLQKALPATASYESKGGKHPAYKLFDNDHSLLGYGLITKASGYGGPITVLTAFNPDGQITNIEIIENYETPMYLRMVVNHGFLDKFLGKSYSETMSIGENLDAVSGATVTSEGIVLAVDKALKQIGIQEFGMTEKLTNKVDFGLEEIVLLVLFGVIIFSAWRKTTKSRPLILVFSVFFLGLKLNAPISLGNIASLISGNAPSFQERPFWFLLIIGALLLVLVTGRNYYCSWLCPFGAIQEGINKTLSLVKLKIPRQFTIHARKIRLTLTWFALMIAFLFVNPSISSYEPFSAFFSGKANTGQWLIMVLALLISIFTNRFWCRFFCPTGAVLDLVGSTKRNIRKTPILKVKEQNKKDCMSCPKIKEGPETETSISSDELKGIKIFWFILIVFIALIVFTLFQNTEVL